ncbi:MAG: hypothetical protein IT304_12035 [Dehalococcoidia bacterium]|nr:hypothetical protein [Dehalococcoidia bacterium]
MAARPTAPDRRLLALYAALDAMHGRRHWHWWPDADPFEVCVGAILVQNTSWANVERALDCLRASAALEPVAMARLSEDELQELVRPSGQFRQKAKKLRAFLALVGRHGSLGALLALPADRLRADLLATWGIGPETADCVLLYAARQPAFIVDAYLIRLCGRLGLGPGAAAGYDAWQRFFEDNLPRDRDLWARFRAEIVLHAKYLCLKRTPRCHLCSLLPLCPGSPARGAGAGDLPPGSA